jgi:DNA-binding NarL/FixJ family response regulator
VKSGLDPRLQLVLVDDHERSRRALADRLYGHEQLMVAAETADASQAANLVREYGPHVVLVDPVREDGRGSEVIESLVKLPEGGRPLIVVHLAFFDPDLWQQLRASGAHDLVLKRTDVDALAARMLQLTTALLPRERWPRILFG